MGIFRCGMCWRGGSLAGSAMPKQRKHRNTDKKGANPEVVLSVLGLLFGYLEYFLDLRPKLVSLGFYQLGFIDCLVIVLSVLLLIVVSGNYLDGGRKSKK